MYSDLTGVVSMTQVLEMVFDDDDDGGASDENRRFRLILLAAAIFGFLV